MALIYHADLHPTKLELLAEWAPKQPWFVGDAADSLENIAAFRFDDPDGEVGVETLLVRVGGGPTLQIPLTYRATPLEGAEAHLIGVMDHSVLGDRYTYDGLGDPVYLAALAAVVLTGSPQAEENVKEAEGLVTRKPRAMVSGTGTLATAPADTRDYTVSLVRVPIPGTLDAAADYSLTGTWTDQPLPTTLATLEIR